MLLSAEQVMLYTVQVITVLQLIITLLCTAI